MKRILYILILLFSLPSIGGKAQQDPMFSQYMFNTLAVNPGYAGSAEVWTFNGIYRNQWTGITGAPVTQTFAAHGPLKSEAIGIGLSVINDRHGAIRQTGFYGDVSARILLSNKSRLAFGIKAGVNLYQADIDGLNPVDGDDPLFQQNLAMRALPNFGAGVLWYSERFYLGVSVPKILSNGLISDEPEFADNNEKQHGFVIGGLVMDVNNYVKFKPAFLLKAVPGAPLQVDLTANFLFYERFWVGAMYRHQDAVGLLAQYVVNDVVHVGYAYDFTTSELGNYTSGSHEVMLGVDIRKRYGGHTSPRYF